jgi:hypothetical protein
MTTGTLREKKGYSGVAVFTKIDHRMFNTERDIK